MGFRKPCEEDRGQSSKYFESMGRVWLRIPQAAGTYMFVGLLSRLFGFYVEIVTLRKVGYDTSMQAWSVVVWSKH